ncbi:PCC domain-containing protein [Rhodovibrionaceae bacterium A322]
MASAPGREFRVTLSAGQDLLTDLTSALVARGLRHAAVTLLSGTFSDLQFLVGKLDDTGQRVATYGDPVPLDGPVRLLGGHALLGEDAEGSPLLHCHALFLDNEGEPCGGHLMANCCKVGSTGLTVLVTELSEAGFKVAYESETNYAIFQPAELP